MLTLTRKYQFSACHRLNSPWLDEEANRKLYGKCNHPQGHGHNYGVEITVTGPVESDTGMICRLAVLDEAVGRAVGENCDHQDLNRTLGVNFITTGENLAQWIFSALNPLLPFPVRLVRVKLQETRKNSFVLFDATVPDSPLDVKSSFFFL